MPIQITNTLRAGFNPASNKQEHEFISCRYILANKDTTKRPPLPLDPYIPNPPSNAKTLRVPYVTGSRNT